MEYFLGSVVTFIISLVVYNKIKSDQKVYRKSKFNYSQSYIYSIVSPMHSPKELGIKKQLVTQATNNIRSKEVRIAIFDEEAYWIANNTLYVANLLNGMIDQDSTKVVDIMALDKVELNKISVIVERLNEETARDNRNSGNEELF